MKKTIIVELILASTFSFLIYIFVNSIIGFCEIYNLYKESPELYSDILFNYHLAYMIVSFILSAGIIASILIIAIQNFKVFRPLLDKINIRQQARIERREAKAQEDKQKRIDGLQAELDTLKNDDKK